MIAFLPHPRHFFDADADDADALFGALPARGCRARAIGARAALAPSGSMQLAREGDCYIISAALPGVRPEEISCIEVVGNRAVRLEVKKTRPRAAAAAGTAASGGGRSGAGRLPTDRGGRRRRGDGRSRRH